MYVLRSISASTLIFVIFKNIGKPNVNTLQTILVNYFTAFILVIVSYDSDIVISEIVVSKWFYGAIGLGILFISILNVMA